MPIKMQCVTQKTLGVGRVPCLGSILIKQVNCNEPYGSRKSVNKVIKPCAARCAADLQYYTAEKSGS